MPVHGTVIELRGIGKVYPGISPVRALDDVSLTISAGNSRRSSARPARGSPPCSAF